MVDPVIVTVLAFLHVVSAIGWLGGGVLVTFVIGPNLMQLSPTSRLEFNAKVLPKIIRAIQAFIGMTFLFGLLLLYSFADGQYGGFSVLSDGSEQGMVLSIGIFLALLAALVVWTVTIPSFRKIISMSGTALAEQKPPPPEMMMYGKRARTGSISAVLLLVIVVAMMVTSGFYF
jgi:uncharacterized membrane protein